jgi:predicted  nucleic acid-binding Zn-ribbon protein
MLARSEIRKLLSPETRTGAGSGTQTDGAGVDEVDAGDDVDAGVDVNSAGEVDAVDEADAPSELVLEDRPADVDERVVDAEESSVVVDVQLEDRDPERVEWIEVESPGCDVCSDTEECH